MSHPNPKLLCIELLSDATFGRGEGTAGEVDTEAEHDQYGIPFIGGKTIRGLLRDSWLSMRARFTDLHENGDRVFGPTKRFDDVCVLRIGDALLQNDVRQRLLAAATREPQDEQLSPGMILASATDIRYQTAEDRETGAPAIASLRSTRVVLRTFSFEAPLTWLNGYMPSDGDQRVLAMAALATRHGGLVRNRGRGHLRITLDGDLDRSRRLVADTRKESGR